MSLTRTEKMVQEFVKRVYQHSNEGSAAVAIQPLCSMLSIDSTMGNKIVAYLEAEGLANKVATSMNQNSVSLTVRGCITAERLTGKK